MDNKEKENQDKTNFPEESVQLMESIIFSSLVKKNANENNEIKKDELKEESNENKENPIQIPEEIKVIAKEENKENKENKDIPIEEIKENKDIPKEEIKEKENVINPSKENNENLNPNVINHFKTDLELQNDIVDQRFKEEIESLHPRKYNENGELVKFPCCSTNTGWFTCSDEGLKCDLDNFGVGIVVYFKILKCLLICFFIICIFNIPLYIIYVNSSSKPVTNYKDAIFMTSIGNIGSSTIFYKKAFQNGYSFPIKDVINNDNYDLILNCSTYNITNVLYFGISTPGLNEMINSQVCTNYSQGYELKLNGCSSAKSYLVEQLASYCINQATCKLSFNYTNFTSECNSNDLSSNFYFSYQCFQEYIKLPFNSQIDRTNFGFIVAFIDIASMLTLILTIVIIPIQQRRNEKFYKENIIQISDYTLHIDDIDVNNNEIIPYINSLISHIYKVFDTENVKYNMAAIYEYNYPVLTNAKLDLYLEKDNIIQEKKEIRRKMMNQEKESNQEKLEKELEEKTQEINKIEEEITKCSNELMTINDLYITFTNQHYADKFFSFYQKTKCTRCCIICCCKGHEIQHLYFRDNWLNIKDFPDEPSNLKWQNIPYSDFKRYIRQSIAVIIAIIVILMSLGLVIGGKYLQQQMDKQISSDIDCSFVKFDNVTDVVSEFNNTLINNVTKIKTYCYCQDYLVKNGPLKAKDLVVDNVPLCKTWVGLYIQSYSLNIGIIIVIPIINAILVIILRFLTDFERNKTVSVDKMSNIWKIFIMQLINTGLIILLVNSNIKNIKESMPDFPLFSGKHDDLSPQWFLEIGTTIAFSLILNVFVPHISIIIQNCLTLFKRCIDSGCGCDGNKSILNKKEYAEMYTGPEFLIDCRYSELLTTIFVSLIYSSGLPILYVACFFSLFLTYWVDKWMLLNFYKKPPQYDLYMSKLFNSSILIGVIFHYLIGIWIYGNKNFLYDRNSELLKKYDLNSYVDISTTVGKDVADRLNQPHNLICVIFLALLLAIIFIRYTFLQIILMTCCKNCTQSNADHIKTVELATSLPVKKLHKNYKLRNLILKKTNEITNHTELIKFYENTLSYEKSAIKEKLQQCTGKNFPELNDNFDENIEKIIHTEKIKEVNIIQGDYSYNFCHLPEFEIPAKIEYNFH